MYISVLSKWKPSPLSLETYSENCEFYRQGVNLHILRKGLNKDLKNSILRREFEDHEDLANFSRENGQDSVLCQHSTSSSEINDNLISDLIAEGMDFSNAQI